MIVDLGADQEVISCHILRRLAFYTFDVRELDAPRQGGDDGPTHLVLQIEDILEDTIVAFRPNVAAVGCVAELHVDPDAIVGAADAAFDHIAGAKLAADFLQKH